MKKTNFNSKLLFVIVVLLLTFLEGAIAQVTTCPFTQVRAMDSGDKLYEKVKNLNDEQMIKSEISKYYALIPFGDKSFDWQYFAIGDALYTAKTGKPFNKNVNLKVSTSDSENYIVGKSIFYIYFKNKDLGKDIFVKSNPNIISCKLDDSNKALLLSLVLYSDSKIRSATYVGSSNSLEIPLFLKNEKINSKLLALYSVSATGIITALWFTIFCGSEDGSDFCSSLKKIIKQTPKESEELLIKVFSK